MHGTSVTDSPTSGTTEPRLVDTTEAGVVLGGITRREVYRLMARGELETVRIGRRRLVPVEAIDAYVAHLRDVAARERAQHTGEAA